MNRMSDRPHFKLSCGVREQPREQEESPREIDSHGGHWYFRILTDDGQNLLEASDTELGISRERLELLAVVRGLEAFEQPSRVTLITTNPQIARSVRQGLDYWRDRNWMWERFGEKVPMSNRDLWMRLDRALQIHTISSKTRRPEVRSARCFASLTREGRREAPPTVAHRPLRRPSRSVRPLSRPLAAATRIAAASLHRIADSLVSWTPDSSKPFPAA